MKLKIVNILITRKKKKKKKKKIHHFKKSFIESKTKNYFLEDKSLMLSKVKPVPFKKGGFFLISKSILNPAKPTIVQGVAIL